MAGIKGKYIYNEMGEIIGATGGKLTSMRVREMYGDDYYANIGRIGGKKGRTGGFAAEVMCNCDLIEGEHLLRKCAGTKGGKKSRRGPAKKD